MSIDSKYRRIKRWAHEDVVDKAEARMITDPERMAVQFSTVECSFETIKSRMGWDGIESLPDENSEAC